MTHTRSWAARTASWPFHSLLFAAYPVVFLFSQNLAEQLSLEPMAIPLLVALAATLAVLLVLRVVLRDWQRAGVLTSLGVLLFFSYGHVWNAVGSTLGRHRYLLAVWGILLVVGALVALRLRRRAFERATPALNVVAVILVVLNAVPVVDFQLHGVTTSAAATAPVVSGGTDAPQRRPDIYYLIFDRYGGAETLQRSYGLDNSPFLDELRRRGFYVADDSVANYYTTAFSLTSSLGMEYLDLEALREEARNGSDWGPVYRILGNREAVQEFLKERGYTYVHLGSTYSFTARNAAADLVLGYSDRSEFSDVLLETTMLSAASTFLGTDEGDPARRNWLNTRYQFDRLADLARQPGPKFVFAHFILPHPPYVFDPEGNFIDAADRQRRGIVTGFADQVRYANRRILELLDVLQSGPETSRPIVILQADEGPYPLRSYTDDGFAWSNATPQELEEKFRILNAYYLPSADTSELYASITPVNSFRVVFNAYFGTDLPLLPDRSFMFTDDAALYDEIDVTEQLQASR
ncbi:MAG: LTA synthase family protein [Chloroflexota bacterium]|nr:LTA synthase family protein [Chloroflexota bacterium]